MTWLWSTQVKIEVSYFQPYSLSDGIMVVAMSIVNLDIFRYCRGCILRSIWDCSSVGISPRFPLFRRVPKVRNQSHYCTRSNDPSHKVGWILYKVTRQRSLQIGPWLPTIVLKTIVRSDRGKFESVFFLFCFLYFNKNYFTSSDPHHDISKQLVDTTFVWSFCHGTFAQLTIPIICFTWQVIVQVRLSNRI